jgi:hypothetical protein
VVTAKRTSGTDSNSYNSLSERQVLRRRYGDARPMPPAPGLMS